MNHQTTVAIFTSTEGHLSLAEASQEIFDQAGYTTAVFQEVDGLFPLYIFLYQFFPGVSGFFFRMTHRKNLREKVKAFCQKRHDAKLRAFFDLHKPALIINTYFMYNPTLEELSAEYNVPLINILPDPKTLHPLLVSPLAAMNLAFDENEVKQVHKEFSGEKVNVEAVGWLTRNRFSAEYDQTQVRQDLGLDPDTFTLLLAAGSDGTNHILKNLPSLLKVSKPLQIVVACGWNQTLLTSVKALQHVFSRQYPQHTLSAIAFTPNLHQYVQAADLVVGKAGPNSLFETTACLKPFFAITHISGQEDGNLDLIKEYQLGFVEENPKRAAKLLHSLIEDPSQLKKLQPSIVRLADYNQQAKTRLLQLAQSLLHHDH